MEIGIRTELKQQMSPQLMYALKPLQYNTLELAQEVKDQLIDNPLLEEIGDDDQPDQTGDPDREEEVEQTLPQAEPEIRELKTESKEIDWDAYVNEGLNHQMDSREEYEKKEDLNLLERESRSGVTLEHSLLDQFHLLTLTDTERAIGEYLIGSIDESGLLTTPLDVIAKDLSATLEEVERTLSMIQTLDPVGVGARNLQECLLLQLKALGLGNSLAATLIDQHWDDVCNRRMASLKKNLKMDQENLQDAMQAIASLNPHPGRSISEEVIIPIYPDMVVDKVDGEYIVTLNDRNLPRLRISRAYHNILVRGSHSTETEREYVRKKLKDANWLVSSIEQRRSTMLRVMNYIVDAQRDFLDHGLQHLKPMILQEVADQVGVHPATVSRVTQGKYVQTPRGVFALRFFFDGMIQTDEGDQLASKSVKDRLKQLIEEENADDPLSDQKLVDILQSSGMQIQRRTIAKYRDQLGIATARMRKRI